jgi:hypothetical protein
MKGITMIMTATFVSVAAAVSISSRHEVQSIDAIRDLVNFNRSALHAIEVTSTTTAMNQYSSSIVSMTSRVLATKTGDLAQWNLSSSRKLADGTLKVTEGIGSLYFDSELTTSISDLGKSVRIVKGPENFASPSLCEVFQLNMWLPVAAASVKGMYIPDLVSTLTTGHQVIRPDLEVVNDRPCVVVEWSGKINFPPEAVVWVDVERGLPMKREIRSPHSGAVLVTYTVTEQAEVIAGCWLATEGTKVVSNMKPDPEYGIINNEWLISVDQDNEGNFLLQIPTAIQAESFKPTIPSGYTVLDQDGNYYIKP